MALFDHEPCTVSTHCVHDKLTAIEARHVYRNGMDIKKLIGQRITNARKMRGLSQSDLALRTAVLSKSRISNYEQGTRTPGVQDAIVLGKALGLHPAYLMCLDSAESDDPVLHDYFVVVDQLIRLSSQENDAGLCKNLFELVNNFMLANQDGREQIVNSSKREAAIAEELRKFKGTEPVRSGPIPEMEPIISHEQYHQHTRQKKGTGTKTRR